MELSRKQIETINSALFHREAEILRLLDNPVLDMIDPNWKPNLRAELEQIPALKNMIMDAMYPRIAHRTPQLWGLTEKNL